MPGTRVGSRSAALSLDGSVPIHPRPANRLRVWAIDRFSNDRASESVVVYQPDRKTGREYGTPLCVSCCDEELLRLVLLWATCRLQGEPRARVRYRGDYHEFEAEVRFADVPGYAHRSRMGPPSGCSARPNVAIPRKNAGRITRVNRCQSITNSIRMEAKGSHHNSGRRSSSSHKNHA